MDRVTIFLRTALFTLPGDGAHLPVGAAVIEGTLEDAPGGTVRIKASKFLDERGRTLAERPITLILPWSKIDHVHVG